MTLKFLDPNTGKHISVTIPAKSRRDYLRQQARRWVLRELNRIEQQR